MAVEHVDSSGNCTKIINDLHVMRKKGLAPKQTLMGTTNTVSDLRTEVIRNNE